jgi:hypothetical protein
MAFPSYRELRVACPYFMPSERTNDGGWIHPSRLPLGGGWTGHCTAPGHEGQTPSEQQVRDGCNLGYASACPFRPAEPKYDSVRFAVMRDTEDRVVVCYTCEKAHLPADHGKLEYAKASGRWAEVHHDGRIQKMAECYLASYFTRKDSGIRCAVASS